MESATIITTTTTTSDAATTTTTSTFTSAIIKTKGTCHILIPAVLEDHDVNVRTEEERFTMNWGKEEYCKEIAELCLTLGFTKSLVHLIRMRDFKEYITHHIPLPSSNDDFSHIVLNLCDGNERDGCPGASVSAFLEEKGYHYAGCDYAFLRNTTEKGHMKKLFKEHGIPTPPSVTFTEWTSELRAEIERLVENKELGYPLLVKLGDSYGSVGLSMDSIVYNIDQVEAQCKKMFAQFPGTILIVEEFINGPEYTVLLAGGEAAADGNRYPVKVYPPAERVFDASLEPMQRWLSYQLVWVELGTRYMYDSVKDPETAAELQRISRAAYDCVGGNGFGRVDIRQSSATGRFYVLEVNASCGIGSESTSDCILKLAGDTTLGFLERIMGAAMHRSRGRGRGRCNEKQQKQ